VATSPTLITQEVHIPATGSRVIDKTGNDQRFQASRVLTMASAHGLHDMFRGFLPPLLPVLIPKLSLSNARAGLLTVFMEGPSLIQPLIGHLADRASLRYVVILAPGVTATLMSLLGVAPSYAAVVLLLIATGISSAAFHAVGPAMAGHLSGRHLGRGMSLWMVGSEFGRAIAPMVIIGAIQLFTLEGTPWLMVAGFLGTGILYLGLKDVPERTPNTTETVLWRKALGGMGPMMIPLTGLIIARSFMKAAMTTYLPTLLSEEGATLWVAAISLTVLEGAGTVGTLLGGPLSDHVGRHRVLMFSMLTVPGLMFAFLAVAGWIRFVVLALIGLIALATTPVTMALVQEAFPENPALANSLYGATAFVMSSVVTVAFGVIGDLVGLRQAFAISALVYLIGTPLVLLLPGVKTAAAGA